MEIIPAAGEEDDLGQQRRRNRERPRVLSCLCRELQDSAENWGRGEFFALHCFFEPLPRLLRGSSKWLWRPPRCKRERWRKGGGQGRGLVGTVQVPEGVPAAGHCCPPRHQRAGGGVGPLAGFVGTSYVRSRSCESVRETGCLIGKD